MQPGEMFQQEPSAASRSPWPYGSRRTAVRGCMRQHNGAHPAARGSTHGFVQTFPLYKYTCSAVDLDEQHSTGGFCSFSVSIIEKGRFCDPENETTSSPTVRFRRNKSLNMPCSKPLHVATFSHEREFFFVLRLQLDILLAQLDPLCFEKDSRKAAGLLNPMYRQGDGHW